MSRRRRHRRDRRVTTAPIWRLIVERPGPIAIEFLKLTVVGEAGYLEFKVAADPKTRQWQRGDAREVVRVLRYAQIKFFWVRAA